MPTPRSKIDKVFPLLLCLILLAGCVLAPEEPAAPLPGQPPAGDSSTGESLAVYFTDPRSGSDQGGPAGELVTAMGQAGQSIDLAGYNLSLPAVTDALLDAQARGLRVRIVVESENIDERIPASLDVTGDTGAGLMHHKFVILDGNEVWTGSMNFSMGGAYMDNNNLARIRDEQVVQDYLVEFEEMFTGQRFGPGSLADTPYPVVEIAGAPAEVYFSPDDGVQKRLKTLLENAQESIYVLAYTFTADPLANTLIDRAADGVLVGMILEESRIEDSGADYRSFLAAGLDVRLDGNDGLMHHKVIIVDGQTVVFGSYNFTASANERNDENLLIVRNADLAGQFLAEYRRLAEDAR